MVYARLGKQYTPFEFSSYLRARVASQRVLSTRRLIPAFPVRNIQLLHSRLAVRVPLHVRVATSTFKIT